MNSKNVGDISEAAVLAELLKVGVSVSLPFGDNQRYDMIVDNGERLLKVQIKTGRLRNGAVVFNAYSRGYTERRDYRGQVDLFAVYCPDTGKVYVVPVDLCAVTQASLRVEVTRNNQSSGILWAKDYEVENFMGL